MEQSVEQKLDYLLNLQKIDSSMDEIKKVRGDLPEEVRDIEDEIAGFNTRIKNYETEITEFEENIAAMKNGIKDSEKLIKKYDDQQQNVRNNREFDAISKEMELQTLEIQLSDKKIKESQYRIELKRKEIEFTKSLLDTRTKDLESKRQELNVIISEGEDEINKLMKLRDTAGAKLDERLLNSYNKLRNNFRNGLAVVMVKRDACGGCFNFVPPQRQAEIKERKKIIVCEHCGRILAGVESNMAPEVVAKRSSLLKELRDV
ncbi:MAG: C4-type zinc ribbon domain-containing protein [Cytophagales bacterium]|nr:C4-type zinc ribbon domain-containing protein [Cytophagales bacterium]